MKLIQCRKLNWFFAARIALAICLTAVCVCPVAAQDEGWSDSLETAMRKSAINGKPVLVKFEAEWCGPCVDLTEELEKPAFENVAKALILVRIDVDRHQELTEQYDVTSIPRVLLIDSNKEIIADKTGFAEVDQWVKWVKDSIDGIEFEMPDVLATNDPPSRTELVELIEAIGSRDAALRHLAMERLVSFPSRTRAPLVESLGAKGKLSQKISAIEILNRWKAPVEGLDPWSKESFTSERLKLLDDWNQTPIEDLGEGLGELTEADLASAEIDIQRLLVSKNLRASLASLTRYGPQLLPTVYEKIKAAKTDDETSRLTALRYWLTASNELRLGWASGLIELASPDLDSRRNAVQSLIGRVTLPDQTLLLELFADSDPLVRELSLKGLQQIGAKETNETMARLLKDPDANVRAAVLKQFAESKNRSTKMTKIVADYLDTETDADLIVHGLRFMREATSDTAVESVVKFVDHESWQVRSEVAESLGKIDTDELSLDMVVLKGESVMKLLDDVDGFVVSRAVESLPSRKNKKLMEDLTELAIKKPEIAVSIVAAISKGAGYSDTEPAGPYFRRFLENESAEVREAGITGITESYSNTWKDEELAKLLKDDQVNVRIAAMMGFLKRLEGYRNFSEDVSGRAVSHHRTIRPHVHRDTTIMGSVARMFFGGPTVQPTPQLLIESEAFDLEAIEMAEELGVQEAEESEGGVADVEELEPKFQVEEAAEGAEQPTEAQGAELAQEAEASEAGGEGSEGALENEDAEEKEPQLPELAGEKWLEQWIAGEVETELDASIAEINRLAESEIEREKAIALACQVALGNHAEAYQDFMANTAALTEKDARLIPDLLQWLPPAKRTETFVKAAADIDPDASYYLLNQYADVRNPDAADAIWEMAKEDKFKMRYLYQGLLSVNFSNAVSYYSELEEDDVKPDLLELVKQNAQPYVESDHPGQQKLSLYLVQKIDPVTAKVMAKKLLETDADDEVKDIAFRIMLVPEASNRTDRYGREVKNKDRTHALAYLETDSATQYQTALSFLAFGEEVLNRESGIYLVENSYSYSSNSDDVIVRIPKPPEGMTLEHLDNKSLPEPDGRTTALVTYFKSLIEPEGTDLQPLIDYWTDEDDEEDISKLVYEAIATTNNDELIPLVGKIFDKHGADSTRFAAHLYWTIRVMDGQRALALRKRIRDEIGMNRLDDY